MSKLTIFHFNCPVCGSHPKEQYLLPYLNVWKCSPKNKIESLINIFWKILKEILEAGLTFKTKNFSVVLEKELKILEPIANFTKINQHKKPIIKNTNGKTISSFDCPFCETQAGARPQDNYFTEWSEVCGVQMANLLYEVGIVLHALLKAPALWADSEYLSILARVLEANRKAQEAIGLLECPLCGRFTTALSGVGNKDNPYRCRWCNDNELVIPLPKDIIWGIKQIKEDTRSPLVMEVLLPIAPDSNRPDEVLSFWKKLISNGKNIIRSAFLDSLNLLKENGIIKCFKDLSEQSYYWDNHYYWNRPSYKSDTPSDEFDLIDFVKSESYHLAYLSFEIAIPHNGRFRAPDGAIPCNGVFRTSFEDLSSFVRVNHPWKVSFHSSDIKSLKTQDNYRFKVFIGIEFPLLNRSRLPNKESCKHKFRLFDLGVWEWRLLWECKYCGFTCYCSCFKSAIKASPYDREYVERYGEKIDIRPSELPFYDEACEVCRGQPSTNRFCSDMYARSIFEIKYGAYVRKRIIGLKLNNYNVSNEQKLEIIANNMVREELGFPAIGEKWITETELYRIIKALFPHEEVIHHYRDKWLDGLELDIYIPKKKLGIEYHGIQHFEAIDAWGGKKGLNMTQKRDEKKIRRCEMNNVKLICFTYEDDISPRNVINKLIKQRVEVTY